jgi:hypothetical protein
MFISKITVLASIEGAQRDQQNHTSRAISGQN